MTVGVVPSVREAVRTEPTVAPTALEREAASEVNKGLTAAWAAEAEDLLCYDKPVLADALF